MRGAEKELTLVLCITDSLTMGEIWSSFSVGILAASLGALRGPREISWLCRILGHVSWRIRKVKGSAFERSVVAGRMYRSMV